MDNNLLRVDDPVYQTLSDFLVHPFGVAFTDVGEKLDPKYTKFKSLISVVSYSILDDSYYIHVKVPSESQPGKTYSVVVQFMPQTETMTKEHTMDNYVIQFFSNSPSFIYKYAALYKLHGYMIDALQEKLDPDYADTLPEKANKEMKLMYDKSIYFATKYLYENRLTYLSKSALRYTRKLQFRAFVDSILSNKDSLKVDAYSVEKKAMEEGKLDKSKIEREVNKLLGRRPKGKSSITKKVPSKSTSNGSHIITKKAGGKRAKVTPRSTTRK